MSVKYYKEYFKGERKLALQAVELVKTDLLKWKPEINILIAYAANLMKEFRRAYTLMEQNAHFDIYIDVYVNVLAPKIQSISTAANPLGFSILLGTLDHLLDKLTHYKLYAEAAKLYSCIVKQQIECSDAENFHNMLYIHCARISTLLTSKTDEATTATSSATKTNAAQPHFDEAMNQFEALLTYACEHLKTLNLNALDLTNVFTQSLNFNTSLGRKCFCERLSLSQKQIIFEAYFKLLKMLIAKPLAANVKAEQAFSAHIRDLAYFIKLDFADELAQKLGLKYLQICRDITYVKQDQHINFCASNLYNLIKLCYVNVIAKNFKDYYERTCMDFCKFLTQTDDQHLLEQNWFHELIFVMGHLLQNLSMSGGVFKVFWANLNEQLYAVHLKLIYALIKALTYSTKCELYRYACCTIQKQHWHIQMSLIYACIRIYGTRLEKETNAAATLELREIFKKIIRFGTVALLEYQNECKEAKNECRKFNVELANLFKDAKTASQANFFIELAQPMAKLKDHLQITDWEMLMRRLQYLGEKSENAELAADFNCCLIAASIASKANQSYATVPMHLNYYVQSFYTGAAAEFTTKQGTCLLNMYTHTSNAFKPYLSKHEKRLLHWLDAQYVLERYGNDTHGQLIVNLAVCSQSKYDFLLIAAARNLLEYEAVKSKVLNLYELLRSEKLKAQTDGGNAKFSRMQQLMLAHAAFAIWHERYEKLKKKLRVNDFVEDNFNELIIEKTLENLNISNEAATLTYALDALAGFSLFYEKADIEQIPADEGGFIDWTKMLNDLTELALYFQLSGYMDYAYEAWSLHYCIAKTLSDFYNCLRSLTFLCEYAHLKETNLQHSAKVLNISQEIDENSNEIKNMLENFTELPKRQKILSLVCLSQIAFHYASFKNDFACARSYLQYVRQLHAAEIYQTSNEYDFVLFAADLVQFRILWKYVRVKGISLLSEMEHIVKCFNHNYVHIHAALMEFEHALLLGAINDFAVFTANRLIENSLVGMFAYALYVCVNRGAAFATAKILTKFAAINLQMEYLQKAETKFWLIEMILGLRNAEELAKSVQQSKEETAKISARQQARASPLLLSNHGLELVRKVAVVSPKQIKLNKTQRLSPLAFDFKLNKFLVDNNKKINEANSSNCFKNDAAAHWLRFNLGTMRARFNFMAKNLHELENFYENGRKWLEKCQESFHYKFFFEDIIVSLTHYVNFLRSKQKFCQAQKLLELSLKKFENLGEFAIKNMDPICALNFQEQLKSIELEQMELKTRNLPVHKKRFILPMKLAALAALPPATPLNKNPAQRYGQLTLTAFSTQQKAKAKGFSFKIYSDRKDMQKADERRNSINKAQLKRKDLNFERDQNETDLEIDNLVDNHSSNNLNEAYIELSSDEEEEEQDVATTTTTNQQIDKKQKSSKKKLNNEIFIDLDETAVASAKPKSISKKCKDIANKSGLESKLASLTIENKSAATTDSTVSPSPQQEASATAALPQKKRQTRRVVKPPKDSSSSSTEDQTAQTTQRLRRLRLRPNVLADDAAVSTTPSTASKRRPR